MIVRVGSSALKGYITPLYKDDVLFNSYSACLWLAISLFCPNFVISGVKAGDDEIAAFLNIISEGGVKQTARIKGLALTGEMNNIIADLSEFPSLIPIIVLICATAHGACCLSVDNASEETKLLFNRSAQMAENIGADCMKLSDRLMIKSLGKKLSGGIVNTYGDYRLAGACALASVISANEISVSNAECINHVYPKFWQTFRAYGGDVRLKEINTGE